MGRLVQRWQILNQKTEITASIEINTNQKVIGKKCSHYHNQLSVGGSGKK